MGVKSRNQRFVSYASITGPSNLGRRLCKGLLFPEMLLHVVAMVIPKLDMETMHLLLQFSLILFKLIH